MLAPLKSESPVAAGQVADQRTENTSIVAPSSTAAQNFAGVAVKFTVAGCALQRNSRMDDGGSTFVMSRSNKSSSSSRWNNFRASLAQIEEGNVNRVPRRQVATPAFRLAVYRKASARATAVKDFVLVAAYAKLISRSESLQSIGDAAPSGGHK